MNFMNRILQPHIIISELIRCINTRVVVEGLLDIIITTSILKSSDVLGIFELIHQVLDRCLIQTHL